MKYVDDLTKCSDAELIEQLRAGDKRALAVIFDRHAWKLDSYVCGLIPSHKKLFEIDNGAFVKAVLIEVFDRIWERHEKLRVNTDLRTYLNKIAVQTLLQK